MKRLDSIGTFWVAFQVLFCQTWYQKELEYDILTVTTWFGKPSLTTQSLRLFVTSSTLSFAEHEETITEEWVRMSKLPMLKLSWTLKFVSARVLSLFHLRIPANDTNYKFNEYSFKKFFGIYVMSEIFLPWHWHHQFILVLKVSLPRKSSSLYLKPVGHLLEPSGLV